MALFHFYGWVIFHCKYVPHLYPSICSWIFRLLPCLAIVNSTAMHTGVHVSFCIRILSFPRICPWVSGITELYSNSIFSFLRNIPTVFQSSCTSLYSHQQWRRFPFSQHPLQAFIVCRFVHDGHLTVTRKYHIEVLICISLIISDVEHELYEFVHLKG